MRKVADLQQRSPATIQETIRKHDEAVARRGFCPICKRAGGKAFEEKVRRLR